MKNKIIAIVVTIVFIAGAGTAIGITVDRQHDKETASAVNEAVSKVLETTATTTTTTESTTAAITTTTTKPAATEKATASTEAQTVTDTKNTEKHKVVTTSKESQTVIIEFDDENSDKMEAIQSPVHTPLGDVYKTDFNKKRDQIGYYWQTSYTFVPKESDDLVASFYVYNIDENDKLFYFDDNGNRIYYKE